MQHVQNRAFITPTPVIPQTVLYIEGVCPPPRLLRWSGHIGDIVLVSYGLRRRNMTRPELLLFLVV